MKIFVFSLLVLMIVLYAVSALGLFFFQRNLLYFPTFEYAHDLPVLTVDSQQEQIEVLLINPGQERAIIYFGGNAEPVIFNQEPFAQLFESHTVYLVNYRGYGGSTGTPSEEALYLDALAVYDAVQPHHKSVATMGRSLGSGVATYLAVQRELSFVILVTPYDSISAVAQKRLPIFPVSVLLKDKFNSKARAKKIRSDTLLIIAGQDRVIPPAHSYSLKDAFAPELVRSVEIPSADHNNVTADQMYQQSIREFVGRF